MKHHSSSLFSDLLPYFYFFSAMDPDPEVGISRRPISQEPMYILLNLGISQSFGTPEFDKLEWPNIMDVGESILETNLSDRPR